jgi:hypothetical protein
MPQKLEARDVRAFRLFRTACSLAADEAALILARFYMSPPANPGGLALKETALESTTGLIPTSVCTHAGMLVNSSGTWFAAEKTLVEMVFRNLFSKKRAPLSGAPAVRRLKTYSAQTGYVYQYYYEGHREFRSGGEHGTEFAFQISPDRKTWDETSVMVSAAAVKAWEDTHQRQLSPTELYAVAKISLFQAFDERALPAQMKGAVWVRAADLEGIVETLGL